jgi:CRISPR-associated exonuclease Cas4
MDLPAFSASAAEPVSPPLTVTHVLEHLYCARFTYFEHVLAVPERQERRWKVAQGRQVHLERRKINSHYLRKKLGVLERKFDVPLASRALGVRGVADEVLSLEDGSMAPFDYKFSEDPGNVYYNQRMQSVLYGLMIAETFERQVTKGFLCYTRSNHRVVVVEHTEDDKTAARAVLQEILAIIQEGAFPPATRWKARCPDCCYRNICIK